MADVNIETVLFLDKVGLKQLWKHVKENDIDATVDITRSGKSDTASFVPGKEGAKGKLSINLAEFPAATVTGVKDNDKVLSMSGTEVTSDLFTEYVAASGSGAEKAGKLLLLGKVVEQVADEKNYHACNDGKVRPIISAVDTTDFVSSGILKSSTVVVIPDDVKVEGYEAGTYLKLVFDTQHGDDTVYVNVSKLVDVYTPDTAKHIVYGKTQTEDGSFVEDKHKFSLDDAACKAVSNYVDANECSSTTTDFLTVTGKAEDHSLVVDAKTTDDINEVNKGTAPDTNKLATSKLVQAAYKDLKDNTVAKPSSAVGSATNPVWYNNASGAFEAITSYEGEANHVANNLTVSVTRSNDLGTDMKPAESFNFNGSAAHTLSFVAFTASDIDLICE